MALPQIVIKSKAEAAALLGVDRAGQIRRMISIGSPGDNPPKGWKGVERILRLEFNDVVRNDYKNYDAPQSKDIRKLVKEARRLQEEKYDGILLIHCHAGKSRSTAAAYICNCIWRGPGRERESLQDIYHRRSIASPNSLMVKLADHMLAREGHMIKAFSKQKHAPGVQDPEHMDKARGEQ